jgi:type I restriction enzyme, S subunit
MTQRQTQPGLPDDWCTATIDSLTVHKGVAYGVLKPGPSTPDGVPMLRVSDVREGQVDQSSIYRISHELDAEYKRTKLIGGEVLLSIQGSVGRAAIVPKSLAGANISRTLAMIRLIDPGLGPWVQRALESPQAQEAMRRVIGGTTRDSLNLRDVRQLVIPLAPESQRHTLMDQVDNAQSRARSAAAHLSAAGRAIERFRQAALAAACSGRLTADWRDSNTVDPVGPGPALSAQAAANASGALNTDELVLIPETWGWWTIEGITERVIDYRGRTPPNQSSGPIPHVRTTQIRDGRIDWKTDRFVTREVYDIYMTRGIPKRDDVLFTMEAPMGEVGVVDRDEPFSIAQRILLMRPGERITGEFLAIALRSHPVRRAMEYRSTGTGVLGIAYKRLRSVRLPVPPMEEQEEIVRRISKLFAATDGLQQRIDAASARVVRSSDAILAKAFRGELLPAGPAVSAEAKLSNG